MKKLLLSLALAALALSPAIAQVGGSIGVYANTEASICYADIPVGAQTDIYIIALLTDPAIMASGITAAEFKIDNLPPSDYAQGGLITVTPSSEVVVGDLWTDFSIAWATPQGSGTGVVPIATLGMLPFSPTWCGTDHLMQVVEGETCLCLALVDDAFVEWVGLGGSFWGNCSDIEQCACVTPTQETSWSDVKSLF